MAVPGYLGTTSVVVSAGSVSPDFTGVTSSGAQLWIAFRSANEPIAAPAGWTDVSDSSWGTGTAGGTDATRLQLFKMNALADGTETTVALDDSGSSNLGFGFATDPADIDVVSTPTNATYSTSPTFPAVTTTGADRLVFLFLCNDSDADSSSGGSGATNAALASITERADRRTNVNNGGGIWFVTGEKATAGDTGTTSGTYASSASGSVMITVTLAVATPSAGATYTLTAAQGSYALTGSASGLTAARKIVAGQGSYNLTGQAATLKAARRLTAAQGGYALTGYAADLVYTPIGGATYTLSAAAGTYTLTGQASGLRAARKLVAGQGLYSLTGVAAGLVRGFRLTAASGSYTLTGQAASLKRGYLLTAATGSYTLTGHNAALAYSGQGLWTVQAPASSSWSPQAASSDVWTNQAAAGGSWTVQ